MNSTTTTPKAYFRLSDKLTRWSGDLALLFLRLLPAKVFLASGLLKWNGWFDFDEQQYDLFLYEFFCPDPVRENALLLCDPATLDYAVGSATVGLVKGLAVMAGIFEVILPVLLILGLFTRIGALGLLGMTLFIQLAVFPGAEHWWNPAAWWAATLFAVLALGPGKYSLDKLFKLEK